MGLDWKNVLSDVHLSINYKISADCCFHLNNLHPIRFHIHDIPPDSFVNMVQPFS